MNFYSNSFSIFLKCLAFWQSPFLILLLSFTPFSYAQENSYHLAPPHLHNTQFIAKKPKRFAPNYLPYREFKLQFAWNFAIDDTTYLNENDLKQSGFYLGPRVGIFTPSHWSSHFNLSYGLQMQGGRVQDFSGENWSGGKIQFGPSFKFNPGILQHQLQFQLSSFVNLYHQMKSAETSARKKISGHSIEIGIEKTFATIKFPVLVYLGIAQSYNFHENARLTEGQSYTLSMGTSWSAIWE